MTFNEGLKKPTDQDVILGRGGKSNLHPGNQRYQELVLERGFEYAMCKKRAQKGNISTQIVHQLRRESARFLKLEEQSGLWYEVPEKEAIKKCSQRLRERARETKDSGSLKRPRTSHSESISSECSVSENDEDLPESVLTLLNQPVLEFNINNASNLPSTMGSSDIWEELLQLPEFCDLSSKDFSTISATSFEFDSHLFGDGDEGGNMDFSIERIHKRQKTDVSAERIEDIFVQPYDVQ